MTKVKKQKGGKGNNVNKKVNEIGAPLISNIKKKKLVQLAKKKEPLDTANASKILLNESNSSDKKISKSQLRRLRKKLRKETIKESTKANSPPESKNSKGDNSAEKKKQKVNNTGSRLKAFIMNLPKQLQPDTLKDALSEGGLEGVDKLSISITRGNKGSYAIVKFPTEETLNDALKLGNTVKIGKKSIMIRKYNEAKKDNVEAENAESEENDSNGTDEDAAMEEDEEVVEDSTNSKKNVKPNAQSKKKKN